MAWVSFDIFSNNRNLQFTFSLLVPDSEITSSRSSSSHSRTRHSSSIRSQSTQSDHSRSSSSSSRLRNLTAQVAAALDSIDSHAHNCLPEDQLCRASGTTQAATSAYFSTVQPSSEQPSSKQPSSEQPSSEQPSAEQPSAKQPSAKQPSAEQPSTEHPSAAKSSTSKPPATRPSTPTPLLPIFSAKSTLTTAHNTPVLRVRPSVSKLGHFPVSTRIQTSTVGPSSTTLLPSRTYDTDPTAVISSSVRPSVTRPSSPMALRGRGTVKVLPDTRAIESYVYHNRSPDDETSNNDAPSPHSPPGPAGMRSNPTQEDLSRRWYVVTIARDVGVFQGWYVVGHLF